MGPSPAKPGGEQSPCPPEEMFFGVYLPPDIQPSAEDDGKLVVKDKSEALKLVKKYKKARFKAFSTMTDAVAFVTFGPKSESADVVLSPPDPTERPNPSRGPNPFSGPKPQDMVRFRKAIELGDMDFVKKTVWENPRYLVSSGDTPSILQEGSRYNALHVAAKSREASICAFVLQTVSSPRFMHHLYGSCTEIDAMRCSIMLDLYLNTPDKALNETPLHFAAKFGAARVVRVLTAYSQCDRNARNKFQQTARDVACTRVPGANPGLKEEITTMLDEQQFYVPVLRSPDHSVQPVVGQPFSPSSPHPQTEEAARSPVISPLLEVQAVAGPMPRQTAELFRRRWKTPPRTHTPNKLTPTPALLDQDKGWEKVGRELAQEWKVEWKEYWPFLDAYTDLSSSEGLRMLEDYLNKRFKTASEDREEPQPQCNGDLSTEDSPISQLCSVLRACRLNSGSKSPPARRHHSFAPPPPRHTVHVDSVSLPPYVTSPHLYIAKSCQVFAKRISDGLLLNEGEVSFLYSEAKHLSALVASCRNDPRFSKVNWRYLHCHLGRTVANRLDPSDLPLVTSTLHSFLNRKSEEFFSSDEEDTMYIESPYARRHRDERTDKAKLHAAVVCVAKAILSAIEEPQKPPATDGWPADEGCCEAEWEQVSHCDCAWENVLPAQRLDGRRPKVKQKRLDFSEPAFEDDSVEKTAEGEQMSASATHTSAPDDSSGEESDTSGTSECEFFTPPSSPGIRSDDDLAMESPDEGPDVYIIGSSPSKLDICVLEALQGCELSQALYPSICRWRHQVMLHSDQERLRWSSTPLHKANLRQCVRRTLDC